MKKHEEEKPVNAGLDPVKTETRTDLREAILELGARLVFAHPNDREYIAHVEHMIAEISALTKPR